MRSRSDLLSHLASGGTVEYLLFWGHTPKRPDVVDASCLSQWFPRPFEASGVAYATAEHFMMAAKARLFGDDEAYRAILVAGTPAEAKALGRKVRDFDSATWTRERFEIVVEGNTLKFGAHPDLRDFLLSTGDLVLVEASPRDLVWGIGLGAHSERAREPSRWRGQNLLGFALGEARKKLRR